MTTLALYYYPSCPFCQMVLSAMQQQGMTAELRDIQQSQEHLSELMEAKGRRTVPVLRIETTTGVEWMGESRDIIRYLRGLAE